MVTFVEAQEKLFREVEPPQRETISVRESRNRILAEDYVTSYNHPDVAMSAVDGYVLSSLAKGRYRIAGDIPAGVSKAPDIGQGEVLFVMTGAPLPDNSVAVMRVENALVEDDYLVVEEELSENENINAIASECSQGVAIAYSREQITGSLFPALFYDGIKEVIVYKKPKVVILSSGDELLEVEEEYRTGGAFNVNQHIFESLASNLPIDLTVINTVPDDREKTEALFHELEGEYDLVVTSGGISRGKYDFIRDILMESYYELIVHKTDIRPGSPIIAAKKGKTLFMAMPGYPVAFLTNMVLYLLPVVKKLSGMRDVLPRYVDGVLDTPMRSRKGTDTFNRGIVEIRDGSYHVSDPGTQKTSHFMSFARCNSLVYMDRETGSLQAGEKVKLFLYGL